MTEELRKTAIEGYNREREILTSCLTQADSGYASRQTRAAERLNEIDKIILQLVENRHFVLPPAMAYEVHDIADVKDIIGASKCDRCGATIGTSAPHVC